MKYIFQDAVMVHCSVLLVLLLALSVSYCGSQSTETTDIIFTDFFHGHGLTENVTTRNKLAKAVKNLGNVLHQRFQKDQNVTNCMEGNINGNYIFNPAEITCLVSIVLSGITDHCDYEQLFEFLGFRKARFSYNEMFQSIQEYIANQQYIIAGKKARKIHLSNGIFTIRNFSLLEKFKSTVKDQFLGEFYNLSAYDDTAIRQRLQKFINKRTEGLFPSFQAINSDFNLIMIGTTYIRDFWMHGLKEAPNQPQMLRCIKDSKEYNMRTYKEQVWTFYADLGDRFGVVVPFSRGRMGLLLYVPKTLELFKSLDQSMNFNDWKTMTDKMHETGLILVDVTFPLFEMNYSRNIKYDMQIKSVSSIFNIDAIKYDKMTSMRNLSVNDVAHKSFITMNDNEFNFASVTYLTFGMSNNATIEDRSHNDFRQCSRMRDALSRPPKKVKGYRRPSRDCPRYRKSISAKVCKSPLRMSNITRLSKSRRSKSYQGVKSSKRQPYNCRQYIKRPRRSLKLKKDEKSSRDEVAEFKMKRKRGNAVEIISSNKYKYPRSATGWGAYRPSFQWKGLTKSTSAGYTIKKKPVLNITVDTAFFYAILTSDSDIFLGVGKVYDCPKQPKLP